MATAEKTKEQQKQFQVPEYDSEEDYDSADDIEYSEGEDEDQTVPNKNQQLQRRRQQQQQDDYSDDDYDSEEYDDDDDYSDDEMIQGKSMQPWSQGTTSDMAPTGGMNVIPQEQKKSLDDEEGMKLKLELNLEIEVELKARIHGDLTLALMS